MQTTGTIYADGRVQYDGYEPMGKTYLVAVSTHHKLMVIKSPGGRFWTNGGENYSAASVELKTYEFIRPGNEPGTYRFALANFGPHASWHPTQFNATQRALSDLEDAQEKGQL
jgi:hypothetical protein